MTRSKTVFKCNNCGMTQPQWSGRCPSCEEWNAIDRMPQLPSPHVATASLGEAHTSDLLHTHPAYRTPCHDERYGSFGVGSSNGLDTGNEHDNAPQPTPLGEIPDITSMRVTTGIAELDRVLSGGLVAGSVTLAAGEPGIGKSTLLLQVLRSIALRGYNALLVSAEESASQVKLRAARLGFLPPTLHVLDSRNVLDIAACVGNVLPSIVVVDSIQAISDPALAGGAGSLAQVRACSDLLAGIAKATMIPFVLVGHVTKDGTLAGPRVLEHLVDTVLIMEGDRHHALRSVSAVKHRFGATGETGLFRMERSGLVEVDDPYEMLLGDRPDPSTPGSVVFPAMRGERPLLVELQALAAQAISQSPKRVAKLVDPSRLPALLAVIDQHAGIASNQFDLYVSAVGGIKVYEPASDLALLSAIVSAFRSVPFPADTIAIGEVGLAGEIRRVPDLERRIAEAARLGFRKVIAPMSTDTRIKDMEIIPIRHVNRAIAYIRSGKLHVA
ncbi:MAG: DNA repair protein RadA [Actinobacteria bacterium]|nr:DNA repair protein RadA [Actinomycetota bacterium]